jgi:dipeptidase
MANLTDEYGYASDGETFSVADTDEASRRARVRSLVRSRALPSGPRPARPQAFIMDWMSKGDGERGAVWVARKVPDGFICGHANQVAARSCAPSLS